MSMTVKTRTEAAVTVAWMTMIRRVVAKEAKKLGIECPDVPHRILRSSISQARAFVQELAS